MSSKYCIKVLEQKSANRGLISKYLPVFHVKIELEAKEERYSEV